MDVRKDVLQILITMRGYIYKYTFSDGKVYVGQTRRPPIIRHKEHFDEKIGKANPKLWEAYQTLGEPDYDIIEIIERDNAEELVYALNYAETRYIQQFKAANPKYGYNLKNIATVPIPKNQVLEEEFDRQWNKLMSDWLSICDAVLTKCCETFEPLTDEEREFCMSNIATEDNLFKEHLDELNFNFDNLAVNSDEARFWLEEAAEFAIDNYQEESYHLIKQYIEDNKEQILKDAPRKTIIVQFDKNGNVVREYSSSAEVREAMKRDNITNIFNALEGKQKSAYGYIWRYKKDIEETSEQEENGQLNIQFEE